MLILFRQVWTNAPQTFTVTTPTSIQAGSNTLSVTLSGLNLPAGESALICVQKGTEVYETQTVSGTGSYNFPVNIASVGILNVTVTAHNYKPAEKTVQITASNAPNPAIAMDNSSMIIVQNGATLHLN